MSIQNMYFPSTRESPYLFTRKKQIKSIENIDRAKLTHSLHNTEHNCFRFPKKKYSLRLKQLLKKKNLPDLTSTILVRKLQFKSARISCSTKVDTSKVTISKDNQCII